MILDRYANWVAEEFADVGRRWRDLRDLRDLRDFWKAYLSSAIGDGVDGVGVGLTHLNLT